MKHIAVIGAGNWGTALAIIAARAGHEVSLWSRNEAVVDWINRDRENQIYLPGFKLPGTVKPTTDLNSAVPGAELLIIAAPSHAVRGLLSKILPLLEPHMIVVGASKGIEIESGKRISQVVEEIAGPTYSSRFVCLSGPSFAKETVAGHPTAIVASSTNHEAALLVQAALSFENLRIYTNGDLVGTELAGSVKNVMAIAAGMTTGFGLGANSLAALITRGLAEITRLALREGAELETLMGLAGLGDLVLTCTGTLSRNRFVGEELGKGKILSEITAGMNEVAEGIRTTQAVMQLADRLQVDMPITTEVNAVLYEGKSVRNAVRELLSRPLREEAFGLR